MGKKTASLRETCKAGRYVTTLELTAGLSYSSDPLTLRERASLTLAACFLRPA